MWCIHREFSYESIGERILKIGAHLLKLLSNTEGHTFLRDSATVKTSMATNTATCI